MRSRSAFVPRIVPHSDVGQRHPALPAIREARPPNLSLGWGRHAGPCLSGGRATGAPAESLRPNHYAASIAAQVMSLRESLRGRRRRHLITPAIRVIARVMMRGLSGTTTGCRRPGRQHTRRHAKLWPNAEAIGKDALPVAVAPSAAIVSAPKRRPRCDQSRSEGPRAIGDDLVALRPWPHLLRHSMRPRPQPAAPDAPRKSDT
jgi:hypothetical protein